MEDKWFIYFLNDEIFFHPSWTGLAVYRVVLDFDELGNASVKKAFSAYETGEETNVQYEAALLAFLISNLLLGKSLPFPKEVGTAETAPRVIQHGFSSTGYREKTFSNDE